MLVQGVTRDVGYELGSERLVLPFIYATLGGPLLFSGLLLALVQFFKFLAQIIGAPLIALARGTKGYIAATTAVGATILAAVSVVPIDLSAHWLVILFVLMAVVIGLCKGINNLAFQDLLGRSLFEDDRALELYVTASISGLIVILVVLGSIFMLSVESPHAANTQLVLVGAAMLIVSSLAMIFLKEPAKTGRGSIQPTDGPPGLRDYVSELRVGMKTVVGLTWFRQYLTARLLLVTVEISMPFFAIHAARLHPDTTPNLAIFIIAGSLGMIIGGIIWPKLGGTSNRLTMGLASLFACLAAIAALILQYDATLRMPLTHSAVFFLLSIAVQGVTVGRTVYLVNAASEADRPYCITISNLAAGLLGLVLAFVLGSISQIQGAVAALAVMVPVTLVAAMFAARLPEQRKSEPELAE